MHIAKSKYATAQNTEIVKITSLFKSLHRLFDKRTQWHVCNLCHLLV